MEQSLHNPAHYTCGNTRRMTFYCFPYRANPTMQTMNSFHNKRKWLSVSLTRRISCLSSQRRTSGPSSDSALKTPRRAMRTAAASWSNEDSMCWIWDCASAQLWKTEIKKKKQKRGGREGGRGAGERGCGCGVNDAHRCRHKEQERKHPFRWG